MYTYLSSLVINTLLFLANTVVTCSADPSDVKCYCQPALMIFSELCRGKEGLFVGNLGNF